MMGRGGRGEGGQTRTAQHSTPLREDWDGVERGGQSTAQHSMPLREDWDGVLLAKEYWEGVGGGREGKAQHNTARSSQGGLGWGGEWRRRDCCSKQALVWRLLAKEYWEGVGGREGKAQHDTAPTPLREDWGGKGGGGRELLAKKFCFGNIKIFSANELFLSTVNIINRLGASPPRTLPEIKKTYTCLLSCF